MERDNDVDTPLEQETPEQPAADEADLASALEDEGVEAGEAGSADLDAEGGTDSAPEAEAETGAPAAEAEPAAYQRALMPRSAPRVDGFDLAGGTAVEPSRPGATVWTRFTMADGRTALAALAAQSLQVPPGLSLAVTRALLMEAARDASTPAQVLAAASDALTRTAPEGAGMMVACALLVPGPDGVEWACAGPMSAGVIRRGGTFDELSSHGPPLGMLQGFTYGISSLSLGPGDEVVVLTGVTPGLFRGAADLVASLTGKPAGEVVSTVHKAIRKAQADDPIETTVLFLRRH